MPTGSLCAFLMSQVTMISCFICDVALFKLSSYKTQILTSNLRPGLGLESYYLCIGLVSPLRDEHAIGPVSG